jgi:hypothetical protein
MGPRGLLLEQIYKDAREEVIAGRPVMELPSDQVLCTQDGRVFIDLRIVVDQMQIFVAKGEDK